jgi:hypothetical protein
MYSGKIAVPPGGGGIVQLLLSILTTDVGELRHVAYPLLKLWPFI